jgi:hypothetical protein
MSGGAVRTRVFRWRSIRAYDLGEVRPEDVVDEIAARLGDVRKVFCRVVHRDAQAVEVTYAPSFDDEARVFIHDAVMAKFPKVRLGFYGEEAVVILRSVVCLGTFIQGTWS